MRSRRLFGLLLLAALPLGCNGGTPRPNIVVILWDTCRGDRVAVNGYPRATTPRLEAFAKEAVTFRRCLTPSPWTPPAHASLFTGLLPRNHGMGRKKGDRILPGIPVLAETLGQAGYGTVLVTSNPFLSGATGLDEGFATRIPALRPEDPFRNSTDARDAVRAWLAARRGGEDAGRPLFLFVNLMDTHLPYAFDASTVAAVHGDGAVNGARKAAQAVDPKCSMDYTFEGQEVAAETIRDLGNAYDGAVRLADRTTGEILDDLRAAGLLEGAFVAICGDHGESLGEHRTLGHAMTIREPVLGVPLVVRWPGRLEGGRAEEAQVRLQDLYPTILEAAGVGTPERCGLDAESLGRTPLLPRSSVAEYGPMFRHDFGIPFPFTRVPAERVEDFFSLFRSVSDPPSMPGARKLVLLIRLAEDGKEEVVREELYDLAADPGELKNLLPAERAAADRLRELGAR